MGTVALALAALAACGEPDHQYVKNSSVGSYMRVPNDWKVYDEDRYFGSDFLNLTEFQEADRKEDAWLVAFDAAPFPSIENVYTPLTDHPTGVLRVIDPNAQLADQASPRLLRNFFFPIDEGVDEQNWSVHKVEDLDGDGFRGQRVVVDIPASAVLEGGPEDEYFTWDQTMYLREDASKVYLLTISCEAHCYEAYEGDVEALVDSWTVRER